MITCLSIYCLAQLVSVRSYFQLWWHVTECSGCMFHVHLSSVYGVYGGEFIRNSWSYFFQICKANSICPANFLSILLKFTVLLFYKLFFALLTLLNLHKCYFLNHRKNLMDETIDSLLTYHVGNQTPSILQFIRGTFILNISRLVQF